MNNKRDIKFDFTEEEIEFVTAALEPFSLGGTEKQRRMANFLIFELSLSIQITDMMREPSPIFE